MEKFVNFLKKNKKVIICCLLLVILITTSNQTFAMISKYSTERQKDVDFFKSIFGDNFITNLADSGLQGAENAARTVANSFIKTIGQVAAGSLMKILNFFVLAAAAVMFLLFYSIWSLFGGSIFDMPWPDKIVFNEMAMFDPNFINPTPNSILYGDIQSTNFMSYMQGAIRTTYFSFFAIAMAIMVIAAMILGIRLALTSIASQKAQYKEMINKWVVGVILLFSLHFILAGAFAINEKICEVCSHAVSAGVKIDFDITDLNALTKAGSVLKSIFNGIKGLFEGNGLEGFKDDRIVIPFQGYTGIMWYLVFNAVCNLDLIASLTLLAVIGQSINLIFHYLKRFFYLIFLGMVGPLVVAVDVFKRI